MSVSPRRSSTHTAGRILPAQLTRLALLALLLLPACTPQGHPPGLAQPAALRLWTYTDLRLLDPADAELPGLDLLAAYTRSIEDEIQVRLDLLDLDPLPAFDLWLALDTAPGGSHELPLEAETGLEWDSLLHIPARGEIRLYNPSGTGSRSAGVRVLRDPRLDTLELSLRRSALPGGGSGFGLQVFLTLPGEAQVADSLGPLRSDGRPPQPARVLFAFRDTLPAYTPALAQRRWDGAHTGPLGGRHGLSNLLRLARRTRTPIVLLDLGSPAALSALDYLEGTSLVRELAAQGLAALPAVAPDAELPGWALARLVADSRRALQNAGLPGSPFLFAPAGPRPGSSAPGDPARLVFTLDRSGAASAGPARWQGQVVLPIPVSTDPEEATLDGPSLALRRRLVETALAADGLAVIGGSLPLSAWGNPQIARATFSWLAAHPWVRPLGPQDLAGLRPAGDFQPGQAAGAFRLPEEVWEALRREPQNELGEAAWQAALALLAPVSPGSPELPELRQNYLGSTGALLAAAGWAAGDTLPESGAGLPASGCNRDFDFDGQAECWLASPALLALIEPQDGSLRYLFARTPDGQPHQVIGPSFQFISGLGEAAAWDLAAGDRAEPGGIPGAFSQNFMEAPFTASAGPGQVRLLDSQTGAERLFRLDGPVLQVEFVGTPPARLSIPLALDPWRRFEPDWSDAYHAGPGSGNPAEVSWILEPGAASGGLSVVLRSDGRFSPAAFTDSRRFVDQPEDPNREYPGGHFLAFPLADYQVSGASTVTIEVLPFSP